MRGVWEEGKVDSCPWAGMTVVQRALLAGKQKELEGMGGTCGEAREV